MLLRPSGIVQLVEEGSGPLVRGRRSIVGIRGLVQSGLPPAPKRFPNLGPVSAPLHVLSLPRTTPGQTPLVPCGAGRRGWQGPRRWVVLTTTASRRRAAQA